MLIEIAPWKPALTRAGGKDFLVYELHLTNFVLDRLMTTDGLDVIGPNEETLISFDKATVAQNLRIIGSRAWDNEAANPR